jgi:hypothetical protein
MSILSVSITSIMWGQGQIYLLFLLGQSVNIASNNNYLCTYDLYGPVRNVFDAGRYFTWGIGGGGGGVGAGNLSFVLVVLVVW